MISKTLAAGFMIEDPLQDVTGYSNITLADIVAIDKFMQAIFDKDFRNQISGFEDASATRSFCTTGLDNLASSDVNITIDNCKCVKDVYRDIITNGSLHQNCSSVGSFTADFLLADGTADSFTVLKFKLYDKNENSFKLYMLPLFAAYENYNPAQDPLALILDGNGNMKFIYIPTRLAFNENKKADINKLITELREYVGFGLDILDTIPHGKVVMLPVDMYNTQLVINKGTRDILNYNLVDGIGFFIDENNSTLYMRLMDSKSNLAPFPPKDDAMLLVYDNRKYTKELMDIEPIYVRNISDNEIDYNGLRMNEDDVESCDEYMAYREISTASKVGRALERGKQIPKNIIEQGRKLAGKIREFFVEFRKADDDALREKIINDEFVPILDNSMQYLIGGATAFGIYFLVVANPLIAVLGGLGAKTLKKMRDKERREKALKMIKDELEVIDEKIADAKNSDDRAQKYALMRIKQNLEGKLLGITKKGKFVN